MCFSCLKTFIGWFVTNLTPEYLTKKVQHQFTKSRHSGFIMVVNACIYILLLNHGKIELNNSYLKLPEQKRGPKIKNLLSLEVGISILFVIDVLNMFLSFHYWKSDKSHS